MGDITVELVNLKRLSQGGREHLQDKVREYSDNELAKLMKHIQRENILKSHKDVMAYLSREYYTRRNRMGIPDAVTKMIEADGQGVTSWYTNQLVSRAKSKPCKESEEFIDYYGIDNLLRLKESFFQTVDIIPDLGAVKKFNSMSDTEIAKHYIEQSAPVMLYLAEIILRGMARPQDIMEMRNRLMRMRMNQELPNKIEEKHRLPEDLMENPIKSIGTVADKDTTLLGRSIRQEILDSVSSSDIGQPTVYIRTDSEGIINKFSMEAGDYLLLDDIETYGKFKHAEVRRTKEPYDFSKPFNEEVVVTVEDEIVNLNGITLPKYMTIRINDEVLNIYNILKDIFDKGTQQLIKNTEKVKTSSVRELSTELQVMVKDTITNIDKEVTILHDMPEYKFSDNTFINSLCDKVSNKLRAYIGNEEFSNYYYNINRYIKVEVARMVENLPNSKVMIQKLLDDLYKTKDFTEYKGDESYITSMSKEDKLKLADSLVKEEELNVIGTDVLNSQDIQKRLIISERNNKVASIPVFGILFTLDKEMYFFRYNKTICVTGIKYEFFDMLLSRGYSSALITADKQSYDSLVNYCHRHNGDFSKLNVCNTSSYFNKVFGIKSFSKEFTFDGRVGGTLIKDLFTDRKDNERTMIR